VDELLSKDHSVRLFDEIVSQMDPAAFLANYNNDQTGRSAYDPMILLRVLLWAYLQGEQSSRKIERACCENLVYIYLCGEYRPDFHTLCLFRKKNRDAFREALKETLKIAKQMSVTSFGQVAIDSTKLRADASGGASHTAQELDRQAQELAEAIIAQAEEIDAAEDESFGAGDGYTHLPETLKGKEERLKKIREAKEKLSQSSEAKMANVTDPDSTYIKDVGGPGYNAQAAVDVESRLITAQEVTGNPADNAHLLPQIEEHKENTGTKEGIVIADAGYRGGKNLSDCEHAGYEPYIAQNENLDAKHRKKDTDGGRFTHDDFEYDQEKDAYRCPAGKLLQFLQSQVEKNATGDVRQKVYRCAQCDVCSLRKRCTDSTHGRVLKISEYEREMRAVKERLRSAEGRKIYSKRQSTVEAVFGFIKRLLRFRRFNLRRLSGVNAEWAVICLTYNIRRLMTLVRGTTAGCRAA
jgi:transposase